MNWEQFKIAIDAKLEQYNIDGNDAVVIGAEISLPENESFLLFDIKNGCETLQ